MSKLCPCLEFSGDSNLLKETKRLRYQTTFLKLAIGHKPGESYIVDCPFKNDNCSDCNSSVLSEYKTKFNL